MSNRKMLLPLLFCLIMTAAPAVSGEAVSDGDVILSVGFDDGTTDGFAIYTNGGSCEISNADGALAVDIYGCGSLDYANQVYLDGFSLLQGCVYTYSFDISCDLERQLDYRLQLNGGDYHAYQAERITAGPGWTHIEADWTMTEESDPAPRLVFNSKNSSKILRRLFATKNLPSESSYHIVRCLHF